jgi:phenylalanyl-tRNA synthetase alpha chain
MVHPAVFESCGVDAERYTGYAFGMGPARIALVRHGIPDIRMLYQNDMRFLGQFVE